MSGLMKPPFGARLKLDHPLARGLVGCWLFNEGSGNKAYDYSGQNNHGTLTGMNDPPIATSGWNAGPHGGALAFDGSSDYISLGKPPSLGFIGRTNAFSIVSWIKGPAAGVTTEVIVGKCDNHIGQYYLISTPGGIARAVVGDGAPSDGTKNLRDNMLHQVAVTVPAASTGLLLYADGRVDPISSSGGGAVGDTTNAKDVLIGARRDASASNDDSLRWWHGLISSVSIYDRALSAEEIAYLYAQPYCMFEDGAYDGPWALSPAGIYYYKHILAGGR